nr:protein HIRA-like [Dermatophagoides farinae]
MATNMAETNTKSSRYNNNNQMIYGTMPRMNSAAATTLPQSPIGNNISNNNNNNQQQGQQQQQQQPNTICPEYLKTIIELWPIAMGIHTKFLKNLRIAKSNWSMTPSPLLGKIIESLLQEKLLDFYLCMVENYFRIAFILKLMSEPRCTKNHHHHHHHKQQQQQQQQHKDIVCHGQVLKKNFNVIAVINKIWLMI